MRDDDLLHQLAAAAREEGDEERRRLDPRWDALAAGVLPAAEAAALRAEAAGSPEGAAALEAFSPLGEAFRARVVETVRPELTPAGPAQVPAPRRPSKALPVRFERLRRRVWIGGAAAAALAATVALVLLLPARGPEPLPAYAARLAGGTEEWRGEEPAARRPGAAPTPRFAPGNRFDFVLTPERTVEGRPDVEAFLARDGDLIPWSLPIDVSKHGAVRVAGTVGGEVRLPPGEARLVIAIGRPGSLPEPEALAAHRHEIASAGAADCRAFTRDALLCVVPVVVVPEP